MNVNWICPNCREELVLRDKTWGCRNGHQFDDAREGYVNLLGGKARKGLVGDSAEMLAARRRFLGAGFYEPLRKRLAELVKESDGRVVAEAGCGEGYYIGGVRELVPETVAFGTDIARGGVRLAAKQYPDVRFAVADTYELVPLPNESVDVLLDVFAPRNAAEFGRVLRPGGRLVVVIPTERHLAELRKVYPLLGIQEDKRRAVEASLPGFKLKRTETVSSKLELEEGGVVDLIMMTPNARFLTEEKKAALEGINLVANAEFELLVFAKS